MASFLQYCTTCEKQISVPNHSVLYCSEGCRKKDNQRTIQPPTSAYSTNPSPPLTPFTTFDDFYDARMAPPDIVPPAMPTTAQTAQYVSSPTDRPGSIRTPPNETDKSLGSSQQSSAAESLRRFHNSTSALVREPGSPTGSTLSRKSSYHTRCPSVPNLSSLSMTPSSSESSFTSAGRHLNGSQNPLTTTNFKPLGSSYTQASHRLSDYGYYQPASTRPLPPRTPNSYSTSTPRSVDLVTPHTPYLPAAHTSGRATPKRNSGLRSVPGSYVEGEKLHRGETGMMFAFREMRGH